MNRRHRVSRFHSENEPGTDERIRIVIVGIIMLAGLLLIGARLYNEQIRSGEEHRKKISNQSVRRIRIPARRGKIYSADMRPLADNQPELSLLFYPEEMRMTNRSSSVEYILGAAGRLAVAIGRENPLDKLSVLRHLNTRPGLPITVFERLTPRETALALECARELRGVAIQPDESRRYPEGRLAAHIIGYVRLDDTSRAPDHKDFFYYLPDLVGRSGIERAFDRLPGSDRDEDDDTPPGLRGYPGYTLAQVDYLGFVHKNLIEKIEPIHGNNVILTLDSRAQQIAENLLAGKRGAMVVVDADNGDVLAAASAPAYDLTNFSPILPRDYYRSLLEDKRLPLLNRALLGTFTPGSIIKPLNELAFFDAGIDPEETTICDGATTVGNAAIRCASYLRGGHGEVNMVDALAWSCNDYMIEHALAIGPEPLRRVLKSAGIGTPTGIELAEAGGTFPSDAAKRKSAGTGWNRYDTALLSIGQGTITVTPLQAALFTAALANGGTLWKPHLVAKVVDPYGNLVYRRVVEKRNRLAASDEALARVRQGMLEVVERNNGSGRRARTEGLEIRGKTGSAERGSRENRTKDVWFIAYTTWRERTLALAVVIQEGDSGATDCAPLASQFFRRYLLEEE